MSTEKHLNRESINRNSSIPIYHQIYTQLKKELMLGGYAQGDRFYSFRKLSGIYGVEPRTVGDALELLINDGFIEKKAASGMYVCDLRAVMANGVFTGNIWYVLMGSESFDHPFYFRLLKGIEKAIHHTGLKLTVGIKETPEDFFSWFTPNDGDGVILTGDVQSQFLLSLKRKINDRMVVVGRYEGLDGVANVSVDIESGVRAGLEKTSNFEISSIGVIAGPMKRFVTQVLSNTAEKYAFDHKIDWMGIDCSYDEDGYSAARRYFDQHGRLADCLLVTEPAFFGLCQYIVENGIECPRNLCMVRYGKEPSLKLYDAYAAVNIFTDTEEMGAKAVEMLLNKTAGEFKLKLQVV